MSTSNMKLAGFSFFFLEFLNNLFFLAAGKPVELEKVQAISHDDVIFQCPFRDVVWVEWFRVDRSSPVTVHASRNGEELVKEKAPEYLNRTAIMADGCSLKLYGVSHHDNALYRCCVGLKGPDMKKEAYFSLSVAEVADVLMSVRRTSAGDLFVICESSGWNPRPVMSLLDAQRNDLTAQNETAPVGRDGLYSVRASVGVTPANGNGTLTCRVAIPDRNLEKESKIKVIDEFSQSEEGSGGHMMWLVYILPGCVLCLIVLVFVPVSAIERFRSSLRALREFLVGPICTTDRAESKYGDISSMRPSGASDNLAIHHKLSSRGVEASNELAKRDQQEMMKYRDIIRDVGQTLKVHPALIAAIISRQSQAGRSLRPDGYGHYDNNCFGLMQINKNYHVVKGEPFSKVHVDQGVTVLLQAYKTMCREKPRWSKEQQLAGALAAYIAGDDRVIQLEHDAVDTVTPYEDFSNDVVARAQWFALNGF